MKSICLIFAIVSLTSMEASASIISYDTVGTSLSCGNKSDCIQNSSTSITLGALTFTHNSVSESGVSTPSNIDLGSIVATGSGRNIDLTGMLLTI